MTISAIIKNCLLLGFCLVYSCFGSEGKGWSHDSNHQWSIGSGAIESGITSALYNEQGKVALFGTRNGYLHSIHKQGFQEQNRDQEYYHGFRSLGDKLMALKSCMYQDKLCILYALGGKACLDTLYDHERLLEIHNREKIMMLDADFDDVHCAIATGADARIYLFQCNDNTKREIPCAQWLLKVLFSKDKTKLATAATSATAQVFDVESGRLLRSVQHKTQGEVRCVDFTHDDQCLISGGGDGYIHITNIDSGEKLKSYKMNTAILALKMSEDKKLLAAASKGKVRVWDIENNRAVLQHDAKQPWLIQSLCFNQDATLLAAPVGEYGCIWSLITGEIIYRIQHYMISEVLLNPAGTEFYTASSEEIKLSLLKATEEEK